MKGREGRTWRCWWRWRADPGQGVGTPAWGVGRPHGRAAGASSWGVKLAGALLGWRGGIIFLGGGGGIIFLGEGGRHHLLG